MLLKDKVAIVTGSDSGIGHAIALELAREGATVTVNYHRNEDAAQATLEAIQAAGGRGRIQQADVSSVADITALVEQTVAAFGRLDIMVNNAGMETRTSVLDTTEQPVRHRHQRRPQERLLRCPGRRPADDRAGRWRTHHQHLVDPRGLADARECSVLRGQGRCPDAHAHRRRGAGSARHHGGRRGPGSRPHAHRRGHPVRSGRAGQARSRHPARPRRGAGGDRERGGLPGLGQGFLRDRHDRHRRRRA